MKRRTERGQLAELIRRARERVARLGDGLAVSGGGLVGLHAVVNLVMDVPGPVLDELSHLKDSAGAHRRRRAAHAIEGLNRVRVGGVGPPEGLGEYLTPLPQGSHGWERRGASRVKCAAHLLAPSCACCSSLSSLVPQLSRASLGSPDPSGARLRLSDGLHSGVACAPDAPVRLRHATGGSRVIQYAPHDPHIGISGVDLGSNERHVQM